MVQVTSMLGKIDVDFLLATTCMLRRIVLRCFKLRSGQFCTCSAKALYPENFGEYNLLHQTVPEVSKRVGSKDHGVLVGAYGL